MFVDRPVDLERVARVIHDIFVGLFRREQLIGRLDGCPQQQRQSEDEQCFESLDHRVAQVFGP